MTPERKSLAEAITRHASALQNVKKTEELLQKANSRLRALLAQSADLSEYNAGIEAKRTEGFKMAIVNDAPTLMQEPEGYAVVRLKKERNASEIAGTKDGIAALEEELEFAKREAADCEIARDHAAEAVLAKETEQMAIGHMEKLNELRKEYYAISYLATRYVLRGSNERSISNVPGYLYGSGPTRLVNMPKIVKDAASQNIMGNFEINHGVKIRMDVEAAVKHYWQALKNDPNVTLDDMLNSDRR
jgi:tetratricopeptide (TPR) repeat protein